MSTRLREILLLSGVVIESDPEYMKELPVIQSMVEQWHKEHIGNDKYLTWKIQYMLDRFGAEETMKAVEHIRENLMYPFEDIETLVKKLTG